MAEVSPLSDRETQVLLLLSRGLANRQIAGALALSENTVRAHVASIFGKLGVSSRTEAVATAIRNGVIELEDVAQ